MFAIRKVNEILQSKKITSKELYISTLMGRYNYWLIKKMNAEAYFNSHTHEECVKYQKLFQEMMDTLDSTEKSLCILMERDLTKEEKARGFKLE